MLRKKLLLWSLVFVVVAGAYGQVNTNREVLKNAAQGLGLTERANYNKALALAKKNNWPLQITSKDGAKADLVGVDAFNFPKYYISHNNSISAVTTRTNQLWPGGSTGLNLNGSSANMKNKLGVWDGGRVLANHVELAGRITQKDNPTSLSTHATHVSGTMIATGVNPSAKGMAFGAQGLVVYDYTNDNAEIASEAADLLLSNHSYSVVAGWSFNSSDNRWEFWGRPNEDEDYKFGYYSSDAQVLDSLAYNAPYYLIVKSAGNNRGSTGPEVGEPFYRMSQSGSWILAGNRTGAISSNDSYGSIAWDGNAKNVLTVGAIAGLPGGYNRSQDAVMASFSSWGPTDDGRIKPDIVAAGVNVLSASSSSTNSYTTLSGTSMSSPNATGSLFLLQEHYSKLKNGAFLRSATLKGLAIHTAEETGLYPGPDYQYGWGLLNVRKAADVISAAVASNNGPNSEHLLYENVLNGTTTSFTINVVASGKMPLRATICWTDVKGTVEQTNVLNNTTPKLVNDLDIRITSGGRTFRPWILDPANPANSAEKGDNVLDNVERIDIDSTVPGQTYTITVTHKGTLARGQQAYSLLISGTGGTAHCASAPTSTSGARIDSVVVKTDIEFANPAGATSYVNNTGLTAEIEPSQPIPFRIRVNSSDATDLDKMVKIFIDYNNDGDFTDANELVSTSGVLKNGQVFAGTFTTPNSMPVGSIYKMRIVLQETSNAANITPCGSYAKGETHDVRLIVSSPSNDVSISDIITPAVGECADEKQYLTIAITNHGNSSVSNIPITVEVKEGNTSIASFNTNYTKAIPSLTTANITFQTPFATKPNTTYSITATANMANDQQAQNNTLETTITTSDGGDDPEVVGTICNTTTATLKVLNPGEENYFWYNSPTATTPLANGPTFSTTTIPANKTFYVARNLRSSIGPATKMVYPSGSYNDFSGNFMRFTNNVPIVIESVRLYTGHPGTIEVIVADLISVTGNNFTYLPLARKKLEVTASHPTPTAGALNENPSSDNGNVYMLNLSVDEVGDHILLVLCSDGATIFRNNGITGTTYPMTIPGVMSITGNSLNLSNPSANMNPNYYFFYDMKIKAGEACPSDRIPVVVSESPVPSVTLVGDELRSSVTGTVMQWYKDDVGIPGATGSTYKPIASGVYKVLVTDNFGCQMISAGLQVTINALPPEVVAREIDLRLSPNPNKGVFNLSFEVKEKGDLQIDLLNESGQRVFTQSQSGFIGQFNKQMNVGLVSDGYYILRITHNKKTYLQKVIIIK